MNNQRVSWHYRQQILSFLESTRNRTYTILGMTFIALIVFGAFAIRPTIGTIVKLQQKVENGRTIEREMQTKIDALSNLQQQMYEQERKIGLLKDALPIEESLDTIIASTELIANKYSLELQSITPEEEEEETLIETLPVGVVIKSVTAKFIGKRADLYSFVDHLEKLPRIVHVSDISVETGEEDKDTLSTTFYYFYREQ